MEAMPERDRALTYLMQRGRIPDFSWKRIYAAMQILAANFNALELRLDLQRQRADRAHVHRHVVAAHAVAARGGAGERAVFVEQIDRDSVDLQLRLVLDIIDAEALLHARIPLVQLFDRVRVLDRQHRRVVNDGGEIARHRHAADALRGRVRIGELRMRRLQLLQALQLLIEFEVADLRRRFLVVEPVMPLQLRAQFLDLFLRRHCGLERYRDLSTVLSMNPIARKCSSIVARNVRRPLIRFRFNATKRMPRAVS